jgi:hypothetical protein
MAFNTHTPKIKKPEYQGIDHLLGAKNLAPVVTKAKLLLRLEHVLQNALPDNLASHCQVMNINDGVLIIEVDSAAYAIQVRFSESDLLYAIQEHARIQSISRLDFRVRPPHSVKQNSIPKNPTNAISAKSRRSIREIATGITHSELKSALLKLAE